MGLGFGLGGGIVARQQDQLGLAVLEVLLGKNAPFGTWLFTGLRCVHVVYVLAVNFKLEGFLHLVWTLRDGSVFTFLTSSHCTAVVFHLGDVVTYP